MKELFLFLFAITFISFQNPNASNSSQRLSVRAEVLNPNLAFRFQSHPPALEKPIDLLHELGQAENPGIHYRPTRLQSEQLSEDKLSTLVCISSFSDFLEEPLIIPQDHVSEPIHAQVDPEAWNVLTEKWAYVDLKRFCSSQESQDSAMACDENSLMTGEEVFLTSHFHISVTDSF